MFLQNKYSRWYFFIVQRAKSQERKKTKTNYFEKHHIVPKSLGGKNDSVNLVLLSSKEHLICHLLLCHMCEESKDKWKMICSYHYLSDNGKIKGKKYESLKKFLSKNHPGKGKPKSNEHKQKIRSYWSKEKRLERSISFSGNNNPFFGRNHTEEHKLNASVNNPTKRPEVREKMKKPKNCTNRHVPCSEAKKAKISASLKARRLVI